MDALKDANLATSTINDIFSFIPFFTSGAGWIITGIIGFFVGMLFKNNSQKNSDMEMEYNSTLSK